MPDTPRRTVNTIENIKEAFIELYFQAINIVPDIIGGLFILLIGWFIAKMIAFIIKRILTTLKIDSLGDRLREIDLFSGIEITLSALIAKVIFWIIMFFVAVTATQVMQLDMLSEGITKLIDFIPKLLSAVIFFVIGVFIANIIREVVHAACAAMNIGAAKIMSSFVFYFLTIMISISALNQASVDTEILTNNITIAMAALFFAFAIGYGIASKDIMANLLASLYSRDKFSVGQVIKIGDVQGKIVKIDSTSVTLANGSTDTKIVMPLSKLINSTVEVL